MLRDERGCPLARRVERTYKPKEGIVLGTMGSSLCILTSVILGTFLSGWLLVPLTDLRVPAITHHVRSSTITKNSCRVSLIDRIDVALVAMLVELPYTASCGL
jgi:hypothetical protein